MRGNSVVMILCIVLLGCNTYTVDYKPVSRNVSVVSDSVRIYSDISLKPFKSELKNNLQYHWYSSNLIGANYGGFNGYLLNGNYKMVSLNGSLLEQGTFSNGLKDGNWKYWYTNGNLKRVEKWVNGVMRSKVLEYDNDGVLIASQSKTSVKENQSQVDSTIVKAPWYKRIFKKNKQSSK